MDNQRKVKIIDSVYRKDLKVFKWNVKEINTNREFSVVVPLIDMLDLNVPNYLIDKIPDETIEQFCHDLKNKEVVLASQYTEEKIEELKEFKEDKMLEKHKEIDQFPCYEAGILAEESDKKDE